MEGKSTVNRVRAVVVSAVVSLCLSGGALNASEEQILSSLQEKQKLIDEQGLTKGPLAGSLSANCDISGALKAALAGDSKTFSVALDTAEQNLSSVAKELFEIVKKKQFQTPVTREISRLRLASSSVRLDQIKVGNDILFAIMLLAKHSASILTDLKKGYGGEGTLAVLIENNSDMSQLILAFYSIFASKGAS
jgi:hypothetical protein